MNSANDEKVVIVTGAGRGIGREIALTFARNGAAVILAARTRSQIDEVSDIAMSYGVRALAIPTDTTDSAAVGHLVSETIARFRKIDILVNNAATNYISSLILSVENCWKQVFEVNVFGVYSCTKAVLPHMMRAKSGCIINIASVAGKVGVPHNSAYSASKAAVIGFTKSVALEVASAGITVNAICPWHVDTELMRKAMGERGTIFGRTEQEHTAEIVAKNPQRRLITTEEVAGLALFLSSSAARGITGQALNLCGGAVTGG